MSTYYARQVANCFKGRKENLNSLSIKSYLAPVSAREADRGRGTQLNGGHSASSHFFVEMFRAKDKAIMSARLYPDEIYLILNRLSWIDGAEITDHKVSEKIVFQALRSLPDRDDDKGNSLCYHIGIVYRGGGMVDVGVSNFRAKLIETEDGSYTPDEKNGLGKDHISVRMKLSELVKKFEAVYVVKRDFETTHSTKQQLLMEELS